MLLKKKGVPFLILAYEKKISRKKKDWKKRSGKWVLLVMVSLLLKNI